jgi:hypothetical protein
MISLRFEPLSMLDGVNRLRAECVQHGRLDHFDRLKVFLLDQAETPYACSARRLRKLWPIQRTWTPKSDSWRPRLRESSREDPWSVISRGSSSIANPRCHSSGLVLHDMIGNVWEWTTDWCVARHLNEVMKACCRPHNPRGPQKRESSDPRQPEIRIPRKVIKAGSHLCAPNYCLSPFRSTGAGRSRLSSCADSSHSCSSRPWPCRRPWPRLCTSTST